MTNLSEFGDLSYMHLGVRFKGFDLGKKARILLSKVIVDDPINRVKFVLVATATRVTHLRPVT